MKNQIGQSIGSFCIMSIFSFLSILATSEPSFQSVLVKVELLYNCKVKSRVQDVTSIRLRTQSETKYDYVCISTILNNLSKNQTGQFYDTDELERFSVEMRIRHLQQKEMNKECNTLFYYVRRCEYICYGVQLESLFNLFYDLPKKISKVK